MPMKKQEIEGCRRALEAKKGELLSGRHKAEGITVERVPDSIEELTMEMERSMAVDALNRNAALLGQVTEALDRIGTGNYGVCMTCENPISLKRLAALAVGGVVPGLPTDCGEQTARERDDGDGGAHAVNTLKSDEWLAHEHTNHGFRSGLPHVQPASL